ncbi:COQ9 family protein [Paralimibaculum aggregatum]|uniref:COQ9 family protein n=1 Tax=Paralimibaculum aggregatum TaxID=3036245 RepID=A0ABQ6LGS9_9RHOB|nr:COQ9 family protein [Limibaculum sp. NKW23]GMG82212.1 COQ9 family protein [Limibaculum sp. NKW23]
MQTTHTPESEAAGGDSIGTARARLIEAALPHVPFDGWSEASLKLAIAETGIEPEMARLAFPRGGVDMAVGFHDMMDARLAAELSGEDFGRLKIRERIAHAVRRRIELVAEHREAVRRGATLLALPIHAADGARAIWRTADIIWNACGDTATDYNWYTKRGILASIYSATVLFWLGDESQGAADTWAFLDRRIEGVMRFEKTKAAIEANPVARAALWGPMTLLSLVRAPGAGRRPEAGGRPGAAADPAACAPN